MTSAEWLRWLIADGARVQRIQDGDPHLLAERLRRAARRRGYLWSFPVDGKCVVVELYPYDAPPPLEVNKSPR